jgi:hypothetical protein
VSGPALSARSLFALAGGIGRDASAAAGWLALGARSEVLGFGSALEHASSNGVATEKNAARRPRNMGITFLFAFWAAEGV